VGGKRDHDAYSSEDDSINDRYEAIYETIWSFYPVDERVGPRYVYEKEKEKRWAEDIAGGEGGHRDECFSQQPQHCYSKAKDDHEYDGATILAVTSPPGYGAPHQEHNHESGDAANCCWTSHQCFREIQGNSHDPGTEDNKPSHEGQFLRTAMTRNITLDMYHNK